MNHQSFGGVQKGLREANGRASSRGLEEAKTQSLVDFMNIVVKDSLQKMPKGIRGNRLLSGFRTKMRLFEAKAEARRTEVTGARRSWTFMEGMKLTIKRSFDIEARTLILLKDLLPVQLRVIRESAKMRPKLPLGVQLIVEGDSQSAKKLRVIRDNAKMRLEVRLPVPSYALRHISRRIFDDYVLHKRLRFHLFDTSARGYSICLS
ncbi:hypothetical protein ACLOJK_011604 [Asimina triloba]